MKEKRYEVDFSFTTSGLKIRYFDTKDDALEWVRKVKEFAKIHSLHGKIKLLQNCSLVSTETF